MDLDDFVTPIIVDGVKFTKAMSIVSSTIPRGIMHYLNDTLSFPVYNLAKMKLSIDLPVENPFLLDKFDMDAALHAFKSKMPVEKYCEIEKLILGNYEAVMLNKGNNRVYMLKK